MSDFAAEEFRAISKKAQETGRYDLELILRVKNFKSPTPLRHKPDQSWESVLRIINEAIKEAKETDDVCAPFEKLCEICGISVPTASVLLAAWDSKRFAIIDKKMFDFFRGKDAYNEIKKIFHIDIDNEKLRNMLEETRKEFDETSRSPWEKTYPQIYPKYLEVLHIIQAMTSLSDLREVEWKIWQQ